MRLPNGFGSITKFRSKQLRRPYYARVTVGKTEEGRPILKSLKPAYYATYDEAYEALVEYNKNPYDIERSIRVSELFNKWSNKYFENLKDASKRTIMAAWSYCTSVYDMCVIDLRARHIKGCMDDGYVIIKNGKDKGKKRYASPNIKERIKSMFNLMLDYALEYEIVTVNYARTFDISENIIVESKKMKNSHLSFTPDEMHILWKNKDFPYVDAILIQCFMGWRPRELCLLKLSDVDIENGFIRGGIKTKYGTDRLVPIHPLIMDLVKKRYEEEKNKGGVFLITAPDGKTHSGNVAMTYDKYSYRFASIMKDLNLNTNHKAHDPRKTFVTMAKNCKVDEYAIKRIVGHSYMSDLTEAVYTDRTPEWLMNEIKKITFDGQMPMDK